MGAKDWMIFFAEREIPEVLAAGPELDRDATERLVRELFPDKAITAIDDASLGFANPPDDEVYAAVWPGVTVVCAGELGVDRPSSLDRRFLEAGASRTVHLHAMHSVVDWFAYAIWEPDGSLRRSLSVAPDSGVLEDKGEPLPFERPFWDGDHPAVDPEDAPDEDPYPLPFHPLELAEVALGTLFGFVYEGPPDLERVDPHSVPLAAYSVTPTKRRRFGLRRS